MAATCEKETGGRGELGMERGGGRWAHVGMEDVALAVVNHGRERRPQRWALTPSVRKVVGQASEVERGAIDCVGPGAQHHGVRGGPEAVDTCRPLGQGPE
eukprot:scaffold7578_cov121-Isochrysis_galbana.AAC.2